jgi:phytoene synthase
VALAFRRGMKDTASARLTRASGTSFYFAFRVLPELQRRAIFALYSFCRVVDDCVDEAGGEGEAGLRRWTEEVSHCYAGKPETELGRELAEVVFQFPIPRSCFEDIVAGCRMDLAVRRYATFDELRVYCLRVASAVGLASIEIFGYEDPGTRTYATLLGLALQITNIVRDVAVDAARDRLYLPLEDLARFGVTEAALFEAARVPGRPGLPGIDSLLAFEADRAREHFERARRALPKVDRRAMLSAEIMGAVYQSLLEEIGRRGHPLTLPVVRLSRPRKAAIALRTVPRVYWGV